MRKSVFCVISCLTLFVLSVSSAEAETYYVATTGCSDTNTGTTLSEPWCLISKAAGLVNPGDTVYLRGGTYKQYTSFYRGGSNGSPVTFSGYNDELAVLDGSEVAPNPADPWADGKNAVIAIYGNYMAFKNLNITKSAVHGIVNNANNNIFSKINSYENYLNGLGGEGSYNTFEYCKFYNNKGEGANAGNVDGLAISSGTGNTVRNSEAYDNSDDGFDFWLSSGNLVEYNISYNNGWGLNGSFGDGNGFKLGGTSGGESAGGYNTVRFNVAYNNRFNGFAANGGTGNDIYNNTGYNNYRKGSGGDFQTSSYTNTLRNNLSFGNHNFLESPYISSFNSWDLDIADPGFSSLDETDSGFLHLNPASTAIDAGTYLGLAYTGVAPDLGAYEFFPPISNTTSTSPGGWSVCQDNASTTAPDLFEIRANDTTANLYFAPPAMPYSSFYIAYSRKAGQWEYGTEYSQGYSGGVLIYTVNLLQPNTKYYFSIRSGNGCGAGPWSTVMAAKTTNSKKLVKTYYKYPASILTRKLF